MSFGLPDEAPCSWSGETLRLRYPISKIWTQKSSRSFGIYWSDKLQFGRLWPEPTDDELNSFYDISSYSEYLAGTRKQVRRAPGLLSRALVKTAWHCDHSASDPVSTILSLNNKARTVCDIGCGSGSFLAEMQRHGLVPTGVDPSSVSGAAIVDKGIEFFNGTAEMLPSELEDRRFDVVSMFQSLEHCRAPLVAIRNAISILEPNGLFVIDVPNMACIGFEKYGAAWWHADAGRHLQFWTKGALTGLLHAAGAKPVKWEYHGFVNQFSQSWIDDMAEVWDAIRPADLPRASMLNSISYLPRALIARRNRKYEIVRVYATI